MSTLKSFSSQYSKINEEIVSSMTLPNKSVSFQSQFPQRQDVIKRTFLTRKLKPLRSKEDDDAVSEGSSNNSQWLYPDRLSDPSFGVQGQSPKKDMIRAYRRIASSSLFVTPSMKDTSLAELSPDKRRFGKKNYILVEESRLMELIKLDEALQKEQSKISQQCSTIAQDYQMPARIPIPATRYAIHHLCEEQMSRARQEIMQLQSEWYQYCRKNHYHKPHLFLKHSYVESAPFAQKALKLRLVKEATQTWLQRKDRDTMAYEDDLSFLTCLYYDALQRQRDYERYYILATRYGPFSDEEFYQNSFPGKRYYKKVTIAAIKLQLLWDRYWAMTKLRRYRAARMIQKYFRRYHVYKKLHPIIRLRLKIGKKTYYMFCFARWKEYNDMCRRVKNALQFQFTNCLQQCFYGWKTMVRKAKQERIRQLDSFGKKFRNLALYTTYRYWQVYTRRNKQLKLRLRRLFAFPHFDIWVEYTQWSKHLKRVNKSAIHIQCLIRKWKATRKVQQRIKARIQIFHFSLMLLSKILVKKIRDRTLQREYLQWKPEELQRRQQRASEQEKQRLQRKQLFLQEKEKLGLKDLKKHLQTSHGMIQLKAMVEDYLREQQEKKKKKQMKGGGEENRSPGFNTSSRTAISAFSPRGGGGGMEGMNPAISGLSIEGMSRSPSERGMFQTQESTASSFLSEENPITKTDPTPHGLLSWIPFLGTSATAREQYHQQLDLMVKRLKKLCTKTIKLLEGHNYEIKYSPMLRCYHPYCQLCFFTEEQYHRHILIAETLPHKFEKEILYPEQKQWMESLLQELKQQILSYRQHQQTLVSREQPLLSEDIPTATTSSNSHLPGITDLSSLSITPDTRNHSYEMEQLEDHFPLLTKYAFARTSTHFYLLLRNIKGIEYFRQYYLQQYGMGRIINTFDCYLAIQEWKKYTTNQSQYYTKAISIYEMYLQEDAVRAIEIIPLPSIYPISMTNLQLLFQKLQQLQEEDRQGFPGFYQESVKPLTSFQVLFGVKASTYTQWTIDKLFLPTLFHEFEIYLFSILYSTFRMDKAFFLSSEYYQYLLLLEKENIQREMQLFQDYQDYRLNVIGNWSISFRQYELLISAKADQILEQVMRNQIEEIYQPIEKYTVRERTIEKRHIEQQNYEEQMLLIDEAIHYTADNASEFIFTFYVSALIKAMWEVPEYRKGMLQYSGYAKFKLKKKNDVMANYEAMMSNKEKVQESKEWFQKFFSSTSTKEKSLLPKDAESSWRQQQKIIPKFESIKTATNDHMQATVLIQKRLRGLLGRKSARKEFAKTYKKYYDDSAKAHYYYNTISQESSWTPPSLFKRLYPKAKW